MDYRFYIYSMRYIKSISEEFTTEVTGIDTSSMLMDYDAFKFNGTNSNADENEEEIESEKDFEDNEVRNGSTKRIQVG